jgi:glycosyltransferase involved in cell wall biosynthesis
MKIALFHNLPLGGAKRAVYEMTVQLAKCGHSIDEYCFSTSDKENLQLEPYIDSVTSIPLTWSPLMKHHVPMMTSYINLYIWMRNYQKLIAASKSTAVKIEEGDYDIIFINDCQYSLNPFILTFIRKPSIFYNHHGALWKPSKLMKTNNSLLDIAREIYTIPTKSILNSYQTIVEFRNIRAAGTVLVNSKFALEKVQKKYDILPEVVYLGVDEKKFSPMNYPRETFFLCVGAVSYQKGYRFLFESLALIPESKRLPLVMVANTVDLGELEFLYKFSRENNIRFKLVQINNDSQLVELYNRAALFLYVPYQEPFGLALLEAMSCGTPTICINEGGPSEVMINNETGFLCPRNSTAFSMFIEELMSNKTLAQKFGQQASEYVSKQWTWDHTAISLERIFRKVIQ